MQPVEKGIHSTITTTPERAEKNESGGLGVIFRLVLVLQMPGRLARIQQKKRKPPFQFGFPPKGLGSQPHRHLGSVFTADFALVQTQGLSVTPPLRPYTKPAILPTGLSDPGLPGIQGSTSGSASFTQACHVAAQQWGYTG